MREGHGATIALKLAPPAGAADPGAIRFFRECDRSHRAIGAADARARRRPPTCSRCPWRARCRGPFGNLAGCRDALPTVLASDVRAATIDVAVSGAVTAGARRRFRRRRRSNLAPPADRRRHEPRAGDRLRVRRRPDAQPDAVRVPGALAQGAGLRDASRRHARRCRREARGVRGAASSSRSWRWASLLSVLRAAGEQLGWGFQLQSPAVVTALAILFFVLALNLSGVFEFGQLCAVESSPSGRAKNRVVDAFGSGVLAVVIASPCTAPFMGAALGFALAGGTAMMLVVFVALGIGMALPYVLLAWFPGWRRRLPRPGPWLARFKQLLAFPLYATVIWLAWVLGAQRDNDAVLRLFVVLLGIGFALWAWRIVRGGGARPWGVAGAGRACGCRIVVAWPLFTAEHRAAPGRSAVAPVAEGDWTPFTPARVTELTASRPPGVRRFHRRLVRHVPGQQAARAQHRRRARPRSRSATSRSCAPTGRAAIPRSRRRWRRSAEAVSRSTCCTGRARRRSCCPRCCSSRRCSTRSRRCEYDRRPDSEVFMRTRSRRPFRSPPRCCWLRPTFAQSPGARGAGIHAHRHFRQDGAARPTTAASMSSSNGPIPNARSCASTTTAATCRDCRRNGARARSSGCRSTRPTRPATNSRRRRRWRNGCRRRAPRPRPTLIDGTSADRPRLRRTDHASYVRHRSRGQRGLQRCDRRSPNANPADAKLAHNYVRAALTEAMAGKPVTVASTSPYGCSIKY